jgi:glucans biosynthesis protein C
MDERRFHSLDAVRAFALIAGIFLHATMSFWPGMRELRWPISDDFTSPLASGAFFVLHIFRMSLFFALSGFFARVLVGKLGVWGFVSNRLRRIALPLVVAMVVVMPPLLASFVIGMKTLGFSGPPLIAPPYPNPRMPPWGHLWFLYLLLFLYAAWLVLRGALSALDRRAAVPALAGRALRALVSNRLAPLALAAPTAWLLYQTPWWSMWQGIPTPVTGLVPNLPALLAYGSAFAFGWFLHRDTGLLQLLKRDCAAYLASAVLLSGIALGLIGATAQLGVTTMPAMDRLVYAISYHTATWLWVFGLTGAAARFLDTPSPRWRYVADASFFVYVMHLPVVCLLQVSMIRWPLHWSIKYVLTVALTIGIVHLMYHYLVRSTFAGQFLNGRKYPRGGASAVTRARNISPG